jgi:hypothetical protein
MPDEDLHRIELKAETLDQLRSFLDGTNLDLGCRPAVRREADGLVVEVYATMPQVSRARVASSAPAVSMRVIENATEVGRARQAEVGSRNRFSSAARASGAGPPRGLGIKE